MDPLSRPNLARYKLTWQLGVTDIEVLRSEFDAGGYDFVTVTVGGKANGGRVSLRLLEKPSGCVICIVITSELDLRSFLWFGGPPGEKLPNIQGMRMVRHTKG